MSFDTGVSMVWDKATGLNVNLGRPRVLSKGCFQFCLRNGVTRSYRVPAGFNKILQSLGKKLYKFNETYQNQN